MKRYSSPAESGSTPRNYASPDDDDIVIAVMGATGAGKSRFINVASNSKSQVVGDSLQSCTSAVAPSDIFQIGGRNVYLLDTPGFDDTTRSDTDTLRVISQYLAATYEKDIRLSGIIYLHRITDVRMTGISRRNFSMFRKLCGDTTLKNVIIVTTMWDMESQEKATQREHELMTTDILFKPVLDLGAKMRRHDNTSSSATKVLEEIIQNHPVAFNIQKQLVDEGKQLEDTDAGGELMREMAEMARKHREELAAVQEEMQEALRAKDRETQRELDQMRAQLTARLQRLENDRRTMSARYEEDKRIADRNLASAMARLERAESARPPRQNSQTQAAEKPKKKGFGGILKAIAMVGVALVAPHFAAAGAFL